MVAIEFFFFKHIEQLFLGQDPLRARLETISFESTL